MGHGTYSYTDRGARSDSLGYTTKSTYEIFKQRDINSAMNPYGVKMRESKDSTEHPNSLAIILALDVTGSMGSVPHFLVKNGLPNIMDSIIKNGIKDPQVLFLGIGDHECDEAPLQVGQFESGDELLDKWLTDIYIEGGGGANDGESYLLAWYFAGYHTTIDCFERRNKKGFLFTIGDEPVLKKISKRRIQNIMGDGQYDDFTATMLYERACKMYNVYHIHIRETGSGSRESVVSGWKQILRDNLIIADHREDVANIISSIVTQKIDDIIPTIEAISEVSKEETMML